MDKLIQNYSNEKLADLIFSMRDGILDMLLQIHEEQSCKLDIVSDDLKMVSGKIDLVLERIDALSSSIDDIKKITRDVEEKALLMGDELDKIARKIDSEDLSGYEQICRMNYETWDKLNALTKNMLPVAEYLFSKLQNYSKPDFSPVVLELCRAVENEFLQKLFVKYTLSLISRIGKSQIYEFLSEDRIDAILVKKTSEFTRAIISASNTGRPEYTLGQMRRILSLLTETEILNRSPLLQDFKKYLEKETNINNLLNIGFLKQVNTLIEDFRNPSAHPDFMTLTKASECKKIVPIRIDYFVNCMKI